MTHPEEATGIYKNDKHGEIEISKRDDDTFQIVLNGEWLGFFGKQIEPDAENLKFPVMKNGSQFGLLEIEENKLYYSSNTMEMGVNAIEFQKTRNVM